MYVYNIYLGISSPPQFPDVVEGAGCEGIGCDIGSLPQSMSSSEGVGVGVPEGAYCEGNGVTAIRLPQTSLQCQINLRYMKENAPNTGTLESGD